MRLAVRVRMIKMTSEEFYVLMVDGHLGVYTIEEICAQIKVERKPVNRPAVRPSGHLARHREVQTFQVQPSTALYMLSQDIVTAAFSEDWLVTPHAPGVVLHRLPDLVDSITGSMQLQKVDSRLFADEKAQGLLRSRESIIVGNIVTTGSWPYYLLGTTAGRIFVMPLSQLYMAKCLEYHTSAISAIYYSRSQLISCSEDGLICLWDFDPEKSTPHDDSTVKRQFEGRAPMRAQTAVPGHHAPLPSSSTSKVPRLETRFHGTPIRHLLAVQPLEGTAEGVNLQLWESRWKEWENTLLAQQEDGSVLLFSLSNLDIFCTFQGVKNMMRAGYIHVLLEYLMVVDEHDIVYVFNMMSQALERQVTGPAAFAILRKETDSGLVFEKMAATVSTAQNLVEYNVQFLSYDKPMSALVESFVSLGGQKIPMLVLNVSKLQETLQTAGTISQEQGFVVSLLADWREEGVFHSQIRKVFRAQQPAVHCCVGIMGVAGCLSLMLPNKSQWDGPSHIRSMLSTALIRILSAVSKFSPVPQALKTATDYLIHTNLSPLALAHETLQGILPARKLLLRTLRLRSPKERQALAKAWGRVLKRASATVTNVHQSLTQSSFRFSLTHVEEQYMYVSLAQALGAVVLSCLLKEGVHITPAWARALLKALSAMMKAEQPTYVALGCLCFAATFKDWESLFAPEDHPGIKKALIVASYKQNELIKMCALKAFDKMSRSDMQKLAEFLVTEMMQVAGDIPYAKALLRIAEYLLKRQSAGLLIILPLLVELVLRSLDPHEAALRKACLDITQEVLQQMIQKLPMSSFSGGKQRLAIGTMDCKVVIYDLKTASRWKVLEDHRGPVTAVAFNSTGSHVASYSGTEMAIKLWKVDGGFLEGIIGGSSTRPMHTYPLAPIKGMVGEDGFKRVRLCWGHSDQLIQLTREDGSEVSYPYPR